MPSHGSRVPSQALVQLVPVILSSFLWPPAPCVTWLCPPSRLISLFYCPSFLPQGLCICSSLCLKCFSFFRVLLGFFFLPSFTLVFSHLVREATISKIHGASPSTPYPLTFFWFCRSHHLSDTVCACVVRTLRAPFPAASACPRGPWMCEPPQHHTASHSWLLVVELEQNLFAKVPHGHFVQFVRHRNGQWNKIKCMSKVTMLRELRKRHLVCL